VSELSLRRSEYSSTLKRNGFQALIEALDGKIESLTETQSVQIASPVGLAGSTNP